MAELVDAPHSKCGIRFLHHKLSKVLSLHFLPQFYRIWFVNIVKAHQDETFGENKSRFDNVQQMICYFGIALVKESACFQVDSDLFRCWKNHEAYDEAKYIEALQRKGSPITKLLSASTAN
ncbi:hypothetical protein [Kovacikia minuta]|uniref:hypothetical protein n=1 Tax=Kovacikia minuta TaxID=2931930 RepID=UPI0020C78AA8